MRCMLLLLTLCVATTNKKLCRLNSSVALFSVKLKFSNSVTTWKDQLIIS